MQTEKRQEQAEINNQVTQNKYDYFFVFMSSSDQGERRESAKAEECLNTPSKTRDLSEKQFLTKNTISITHLAFFLYWRSFSSFFLFFFLWSVTELVYVGVQCFYFILCLQSDCRDKKIVHHLLPLN